AHGDYGRDDFDPRFGACAFAHERGKGAVKLRAAIGIAGAVFGHGADEDCGSADYFRPTHGRGKKMRVAKRDVRDWDARIGRESGARFRDGDALVRERRAAHLREGVEADHEALVDAVEIS